MHKCQGGEGNQVVKDIETRRTEGDNTGTGQPK